MAHIRCDTPYVTHRNLAPADGDAAEDEAAPAVARHLAGIPRDGHGRRDHGVIRPRIADTPYEPSRARLGEEESKLHVMRHPCFESYDGFLAGRVSELGPERGLAGVSRSAEQQVSVGSGGFAHGLSHGAGPAEDHGGFGDRNEAGLVDDRDPEGGPAVAILLLYGSLARDRAGAADGLQRGEHSRRESSSEIHGTVSRNVDRRVPVSTRFA